MPLANAGTSTSSAGAPLRVINHDSDDDWGDWSGTPIEARTFRQAAMKRLQVQMNFMAELNRDDDEVDNPFSPLL